MINISGNLRNFWNDSGNMDNEKYLAVNCCGYQKFLTRNYTISRDKGRVDYQIIYLIKGSGYYQFDCQETTRLDEGTVIVFTPNQPQHYKYYFKDSTELYWIHFTGNGVDEQLSNTGLLGRSFYNIGISSECIEIFGKIIQELQIKNPMYMQYSAAIFMELLACIGRRMEHLKGSTIANSDDFSKMLALMHSKYNEPYSAKYYAKICNLGVYSFIHKFKKLSGISPVEYITKIRIDEAKDLLSRSSLSIKEISNIVGYDNPLYFSRVFKNTTGIAPSHYKRNIHLSPGQD